MKKIWILQIIPAVILLQSLFFKFTAAPESIEIFTKLGIEPWGRILTGVIELIVVIMLLTPRLAATGALLGFGVMTGAVIGHLTKLGIVVQNDGGLLFGLALVVMVTTGIIVYVKRNEIILIGDKI